MNHPSNDQVQVQVRSEYLADESTPSEKEYVFRYSVTIHNQSTIGLKLISRYWKVTDNQNQLQEIQGQGVMGQQPKIAANQDYQYDSLVMIETPIGIMEGSFTLIDEHHNYSLAEIKPFILAEPTQLH